MVKKIILNIFFLLICLDLVKSQEVLIGLQSNPAIQSDKLKYPESKGISADTLTLPFFDDFSNEGVFPDAAKWSDKFALINNTYTKDQITTGVATLDALDDEGRLYEAASNIVFEADHLTSLPLNLSLAPSDSVRLSFYYQPAGLGDVPETSDSLVVQFYAPAEGKWYHAWKAEGGKYSDFKIALIKIDNPRFLKKGFRFRFINYASLSANLSEPSMIGNCDQWNLDYILIGKYRTNGDSVFHDVAFRYPHRSLLNTYESIPYKHFRQIALQEMGAVIPVHYRNNDLITRNVTRNFEIWDIYNNSLVRLLTAGASNVAPHTDIDDSADLIYTFNSSNEDSALFRITSWLITDNFDPKANDTVVYYQRFSNYFAYDDGSSEGGYGINGLGSRNAMVACRFKSYIPDTLRAIRLCFNDSYMNSNQRVFDLMVWDDVNGIPGNVLYTQEKAMVQQGADVNGYHTYILREGVPVSDVFYVGWKQRTETFLNAGFDINTPNKGNLLYWINGNWFPSSEKGSLMIRPVVGDQILTSVRDITFRQWKELHIYPNPARNYVIIDNTELEFNGDIFISFVDINGREVLKGSLERRMDISMLHEGIYLVVASRNSIPVGYSRILKIK